VEIQQLYNVGVGLSLGLSGSRKGNLNKLGLALGALPFNLCDLRKTADLET
jgi:hypothetical protein